MKQSFSATLQGVFISTIIAAGMMSISSATAQTADEIWSISQSDVSVGARMSGMAIRGLAGFGDYSALYGNPAGLGYVGGTEFVVSLRGSSVQGDAGILATGFDLRSSASTVENSGIGNLAFLYSVPVAQGKLVGGVAFSQVRNYSRKLDLVGENVNSTISASFLPFDNEYSVGEDGNLGELADLPFAAFNGGIFEYFKDLYEKGEYPFYSAVVPGTLIEQSARVTESGEAYELNAGVAWQATKDIMVGGSLNIVLGDYQFDYSFVESDILDENTEDEYNVLRADGSLLEGFDQLEYQQTLRSDLGGINFRAGMSTVLNSTFRVGFTLVSPTWTYFEESYGEQFSTRFDLGGELAYGDQINDVGNGTFEYSARTPWRLGAGVRAKFGRFMLTGESEIIDWSQLRLNADGNAFRGVNRFIENEYGIALNYAFGGEVNLGKFDLRTGVAFRPSPYSEPPSQASGELHVGDRLGVSLGLGIQITDGIRVDLGLHAEDERNVWDLYPSDGEGPRQDERFEIDELLSRGIAILQLTVKL